MQKPRLGKKLIFRSTATFWHPKAQRQSVDANIRASEQKHDVLTTPLAAATATRDEGRLRTLFTNVSPISRNGSKYVIESASRHIKPVRSGENTTPSKSQKQSLVLTSISKFATPKAAPSKQGQNGHKRRLKAWLNVNGRYVHRAGGNFGLDIARGATAAKVTKSIHDLEYEQEQEHKQEHQHEDELELEHERYKGARKRENKGETNAKKQHKESKVKNEPESINLQEREGADGNVDGENEDGLEETYETEEERKAREAEEREERIVQLQAELEEANQQLRWLSMSQSHHQKGVTNLYPYRAELQRLKANPERLPKWIVEQKVIATLVQMQMKKMALKAPQTHLNANTHLTLSEHLKRSNLQFLLRISPKSVNNSGNVSLRRKGNQTMITLPKSSLPATPTHDTQQSIECPVRLESSVHDRLFASSTNQLATYMRSTATRNPRLKRHKRDTLISMLVLMTSL